LFIIVHGVHELDSPVSGRVDNETKPVDPLWEEKATMSIQFKVPDMACSACAEAITNAITVLDGSARVSADPNTKWVTIETVLANTAVKTAITTAGYTVSD
jgi:copper chaperone